jgi:hypothetical protein
MRETRSVLGNEDFETVFGEAGYEPELIIDNETFFRPSH